MNLGKPFPFPKTGWRRSTGNNNKSNDVCSLTYRSTRSLTNQDLPPSKPSSHLKRSQLERILQACACASSAPTHPHLQHAQQLHSQLIVNGSPSNGLLWSRTLGIYVLSDAFSHATTFFYSNTNFNTNTLQRSSLSLPWNWMIRGCNRLGLFRFSLLFYFKMLACGVSPDTYTFPSVVKAACGLNHVGLGRFLHHQVLEMGFRVDVFVGSALVKLFIENGCIGDAARVFGEMPLKDCVLWNVTLYGLAKSGEKGVCLRMFKDMRAGEAQPDSLTFACVLSVCASEGLVKCGRQLHGLAVVCGLGFEPPVANTLVAMYTKSRLLDDAGRLFKSLPHTSSVTWNGMIAGCVQNGFMNEALSLLREMISADVKPDATTFASFLPCLADSACLKLAKEVHAYLLRCFATLDMFLVSAFIDIYSKCGDTELSRKIFDSSASIDIVVCTAMISGYVTNGMNVDALETFRWLIQEKMFPNALTFSSILPACAGLASLKLGKELHGNIVKKGLDVNCYVGSAILDMYAECGKLDLALSSFWKISKKDFVSWNAIITSCCQNARPGVAIDLFRQMGMERIGYDCVSISAALSACAHLPSLNYGKEIHSYLIKGICADVLSESALIDMYAKCGDLSAARRVFEVMKVKNEISWNSIIAAYGIHGHLDESISLFHRMLENGIQPDHISFLSILSACGHTGRVEDGIHYFHCMTEEYGIPPGMEHYSCIVDMYGRAGCLDEAFNTIKNMPYLADAGIWGTLLGACGVHGNVELAEVASRNLLHLDPANSGYYLLRSNTHANAGQWDSVIRVRRLMKEQGVQKVPGYSWIEINNRTDMFVSADGSHPQSTQIFSLLRILLAELKEEGYIPLPVLPMQQQYLSH